MKINILILTFLLVGLANGLIAQTDTLKNNVFGGFQMKIATGLSPWIERLM